MQNNDRDTDDYRETQHDYKVIQNDSRDVEKNNTKRSTQKTIKKQQINIDTNIQQRNAKQLQRNKMITKRCKTTLQDDYKEKHTKQSQIYK